MLDDLPQTYEARIRSLATALRSATGASRIPRSIAVDLLDTAMNMTRPENPTQVLQTSGPLAPHIQNTMRDTSATRARLANWTLDF